MIKKILFFLFLVGLFFLPTLQIAEAQLTETDGVGVSVSVTEEETGGGGGGEDPEDDVEGCTDPLANNYNENATVDDGSCDYDEIVPSVSYFVATWSEINERVNLSWQNPSDYNDFSAVRIIRTNAGTIPNDHNDGILIYDGSLENAFDESVLRGNSYFYWLYVRSNSGDYSEPTLAEEDIPEIVEEECEEDDPDCEEEPPDDEEEDDDDNDDEEEDDESPFEDFPVATSSDPVVKNLDRGDFIFSQRGEIVQYFKRGDTIRINGSKNLTVSLPVSLAPKSLKTIGITLFSPDDKTKSFSFILRLNKERTFYTATVAPLNNNGNYKLKAFIFNFSNQTIKTIDGNLLVASSIFSGANTQEVVQTGKIITVAAGTVAVVTQTVLVTSQITSLADFYLVITKIIGAILGFFGIKRRRKPWGTVYDAVTKRPIDPAYVEVVPLNDTVDKKAKSAITDIDGRYGFYVPAGSYIIKAGKTNYKFPSTKLMGRSDDELYSNLYFGDPVELKGESVINKNIPLDPIGFDWNEFAKSKTDYFKIYSRKESRRNLLLGAVYWLGFIVSLGDLIYSPEWTDVVLILIYIGLYLMHKFWEYKHKPVQVLNEKKGEPLPFSVVRFYLAGTDVEVKRVITDELGRFYTLLRPDTYYYTVEEKVEDGSYEKVFTSDPVKLDKGVIRENIRV